MSRRRKKRSPQIAVESLEPKTLLCGSSIGGVLAVHDQFSWPAEDSAESYEVWLNDAESNQLAFRQDGLSIPELNLQDLEDGDYFAWVQDENTGGDGPWRERERIKVRDGKLIGSAGVLTWQPMAGAETYEVWISRDGQRFGGASSLSDTSYQLPAMDDGDYDYWIQREDSTGQGDWNTRMTFVVQSGTLASEASVGTLTWDGRDSAFGYEAWIRSADTGERIAGAKALADSAFEVPFLEDGAYELLVQDEDSSGDGTWRNTKPFLVEHGRLKASPSVGKIDWDAEPEAVSFEIWVSSWGSTERILGASGLTESEFRLPELGTGVYDYWIRTETAAGTSEWAPKITFQVEDGEIGDVAPAGDLTWEASPAALSYNIWIRSEELGRNVVSLQDITGESTEIPYLADGLYQYWVRTNTADDAVWSDRQYLRVSNGSLRTSSGFLYWGSDPEAVSYELEVTSRSDDQDIVFRLSGITETQVDIPMLPDGNYQFRVQYENSRGRGSWSELIDFRIENGHVQRFQTGTFGTFITTSPYFGVVFPGTLCSEPVTLHL